MGDARKRFSCLILSEVFSLFLSSQSVHALLKGCFYLIGYKNFKHYTKTPEEGNVVARPFAFCVEGR